MDPLLVVCTFLSNFSSTYLFADLVAKQACRIQRITWISALWEWLEAFSNGASGIYGVQGLLVQTRNLL